MAVEKLRSGEAMNATPVVVHLHGGFDRFVRHCARYRMVAPLIFPRGGFKFQSVDEAQQARAEIARENARRLRGDGPMEGGAG